MNQSLAVFIVTVLLCKGVDSVSLKDEDFEMADKLFTFGAEAVLKYLDNIKGAAEAVVRKNKISKTGTEMQDLWISVKEMMEKISAEKRVKGHDQFIVSLHIFHRLATLCGDGLYRLIYAVPARRGPQELGMYKGIFRNETLVDLWKYVESRYLPGAPQISSDPLGFLAHLLSKLVAQPQMIEILKAVAEVGKTDINQLFNDVQMAVDLLRKKIMEISILERKSEKDEFLITLRTASGVLAFYWDELLEYTESQPFHDKYLTAVRRWQELRVSKDTEKYRMFISPETGLQAWTWADERFGDFFDNSALEYDRWGNGLFGNERFNQSNWAIIKMATVYPLPIYERLSENGLGMSKVNDFFIDTEDTLTELVGEDVLSNLKEERTVDPPSIDINGQHLLRSHLRTLSSILRGALYEIWNIISNEILHVSINKKYQMTSNVEYKDPLQHLRKIKATCFEIWDRVLTEINRNINNDGLEQSSRHWGEVKSIFMKELTDSGQLTQKRLDEAQKTLNSLTRTLFSKYVQMIEGLEERISASTETLGKLMLKTFSATDTVLVNSLGFLLSD